MSKFNKYIKRNRNKIVRLLLFVASTFLIILLFPHEGRFKYEFQQGKPWMHDDLIAPFDFPVRKSNDQIAQEKQIVLKKAKPYFKINAELVVAKRGELENLFKTEWKKKHPLLRPDSA